MSADYPSVPCLTVAESASISGHSGSQPASLLSSTAVSLPSRLSSGLAQGHSRRTGPGESTPSLGGGSVRSASSGGRTAVSSLARRPSLPETVRYPAKVSGRLKNQLQECSFVFCFLLVIKKKSSNGVPSEETKVGKEVSS